MLNKKIGILLASSFGWSVAVGFLAPFYAIFVQRIGGNLLDAGLAYSAYFITLGLMILIFGHISDKKKIHIELLIVSGVLMTLCYLQYLFVKTNIHFLLVQVILGFAEAMSFGSYDATFTKHVEKGKEAFQWGSWGAVDNISKGVAALASGVVITMLGFPALFILMVFFQALSTTIIWIYRKELV